MCKRYDMTAVFRKATWVYICPGNSSKVNKQKLQKDKLNAELPPPMHLGKVTFDSSSGSLLA